MTEQELEARIRASRNQLPIDAEPEAPADPEPRLGFAASVSLGLAISAPMWAAIIWIIRHV